MRNGAIWVWLYFLFFIFLDLVWLKRGAYHPVRDGFERCLTLLTNIVLDIDGWLVLVCLFGFGQLFVGLDWSVESGCFESGAVFEGSRWSEVREAKKPSWFDEFFLSRRWRVASTLFCLARNGETKVGGDGQARELDEVFFVSWVLDRLATLIGGIRVWSLTRTRDRQKWVEALSEEWVSCLHGCEQVLAIALVHGWSLLRLWFDLSFSELEVSLVLVQ